MYDLATIQAMSEEAALVAEEEGLEPAVYNGDFEAICPIPNLGTYIPDGWELVEKYFVDSSGFGQEGEPALTIRQFKSKLIIGRGYAVIEAGQFQVYIGEFEKLS